MFIRIGKKLKNYKNIRNIYSGKPEESYIKLETLGKQYTIVMDFENKFLREIVPIPPIENLSIKGGGVRGTAYVGALQELDLKQIKRVSGASAGAITAFMIALGFSSDKIQEISNSIPLSSLVNKIPRAGLKMTILFNRAYMSIDDNRLDDGMKMLAVLRGIIKKRINELMLLYPERLHKLEINLDCVTFGDLKKIAALHPEEYLKELYVTGVKLIKDSAGKYQSEVEIFSTESQEAENMEAAFGVKISATLPYFNKAVNYNNNLYIDGGCLDDFPIHIFDDPKFKPKNIIKYRSKNGANLCTLGLCVESKSNCENMIHNRKNIIEKQISRKNKIISEIENHVIHTDKIGRSNLLAYYLYHKYPHTTVLLDDHGIDRADFGMSNQMRDELMKNSRKTIRNWLDLYRNNESIMEDNTYGFDEDIDDAISKLCQKLSKSELSEFIKQLENYTPGLLIDKNNLCKFKNHWVCTLSGYLIR